MKTVIAGQIRGWKLRDSRRKFVEDQMANVTDVLNVKIPIKF